MFTLYQLNPVMLPLIQKFYKQHYKPARPRRNDDIFIIRDKNTICGVVMLRNLNTCRLLTGMLVAPEYRHRGLAHDLLAYCRQATLAESDFCFCSVRLKPFYQSHGFTAIPAEKLPSELQSRFCRYQQSGEMLAMAYNENKKSS